jgi:hypothetical protein
VPPSWSVEDIELSLAPFLRSKRVRQNAARYIDQFLKGHLKDFHTQVKVKRHIIYFQQDGAPSHRSKVVSSWLRLAGIPHFQHPALSPDVSPIEPLWHDLKTLISQRQKVPADVEQLKSAVRKAWDQISIETINSHVDRVPDRIKALIQAKGGHTGF